MMPSRIFAGTSRSTTTESDCPRIPMGSAQSENNAATAAADRENEVRSFLGILPPGAHRKSRDSYRQPRTIANNRYPPANSDTMFSASARSNLYAEKGNHMRKIGVVGVASLLAFAAGMFFYNERTHAAAASGYKVGGKIPVAGEGGWDY